MEFLSYFNIGAGAVKRDHKYQKELVDIMLVLSLCLLSLFATIHFFRGDTLMALFQVMLLILYAFSYFDPFKVVTESFKENTVVVGTIVIFSVLFADGSIAGTGIYWAPFFPFLVFALKGFQTGWFWIAIFIVSLCSIQALDYFEVLSVPYTLEHALFFFITFLFYIIVAALFESLRMRQQVALESNNNDLQAVREKLSQTMSGLEKEIQAQTSELQETNRQLEQEIKDHKLTNEDLTETEQKFYQAQKIEALGILVGGIAHDFNNILSGVNANLFLIQRQIKDKPKVQEQLDEIELMVFHAANITKQLLTFARKDNVEKEFFDLSSFMKEGIKLAVGALPSRISIKINLSKSPLLISGNATQLQQVIINLLNNAKDALSHIEEPLITIDMSELQDAGELQNKHPDLLGSDWLCISVSDNGEGVASACLQHIFDPFFTTKEEGKGTGLGLAMCYGAIQSHGGVIEVESELGEGCTFHIYLPVVKEKRIKKVERDVGAIQQGKGERILLADDDKTLCRAHRDVLKSLGYEVEVAYNGFEAIKCYAESGFDLVILDIMMPEMGGIKAAEHILTMDEHAKIFFVSGYEKGGSTERFLSENFAKAEKIKRLDKPFTMSQLCQAIRHALDE